jgi:hypothetical protein
VRRLRPGHERIAATPSTRPGGRPAECGKLFVVAGKPSEEHLDVYQSRTGWWNPDHGDIDIPPGWELLPRGDTFLTRRVKAAGPYWLAWSPRTRTRPHRRAIGVLAPRTAIDEARAASEATATQRAAQRTAGAKLRERQEATYRSELAAAIVVYLNFAPRHSQLASEIAERAATRAGEVGSGRVGRTRLLALEERAELAARADIRHHHTDYEDNLADLYEDDLVGDDWLYREIRTTAHGDVDDFLDRHRKP